MRWLDTQSNTKQNEPGTNARSIPLICKIFDSVPVAIFIVDNTGWILDCNKTAEIKTCLSRETLLKERLFMLSSAREVNDFSNSIKVLHKMNLIKTFAELVDDPTPRQIKVPLVNPSNEKTWYTFTITHHLHDGKDVFVIHAVESSIPIEIQDTVESSEQKYRHLFDTQPFSIMLINDKMRISECNFAVERLTGYPMGEIVGRRFSELPFLTSQQVDLLLDQYERFVRGERNDVLVLDILTKSGSIVWVELLPTTLLFEKRTFIQLICQDVTEKVKIKQLVEEENKRLKELDTMRKSFITNASHEIKTPLTSIDGASAFLADKYNQLDDSHRLELIRLVRRGSTRLKALTSALLDFSGVENKEMTISLVPTALLDVINEAIAGLSFLFDQRHHHVDVFVDAKISVLADMVRLEQVLSNIISNAAKNTSPHGNIEISATVSNNSVIVSVKDTGVGIEPDEMGKLFQKFGKIERQGTRANIDIQGPGIGLYITREIITLHGGMIWAESAGRGKGATFKFTIPLAGHLPSATAHDQGSKLGNDCI